MASESALLASKFAISATQTRALVASWLVQDSVSNVSTSSDRIRSSVHGSQDKGEKKGQKGQVEGENGVKSGGIKSRENGSNTREKVEDQGEDGQDEVSANDELIEDEDIEFNKKYHVIVGRGGIGTPNQTEESTGVNSFRQRKTVEFMKKQIDRRKAEGHKRIVPLEQEEEEEEEEESRNSIKAKSVDVNGHVDKKTKMSILDDLLMTKQQKQSRKHKHRKR
ncbi:hypothetical protein V1512DRAFT_203903 [Lipomyces arxii]|uniref:uncharacterized protein n=1 Tax=Lipomyces arxii TaxID=56418 RepID=UPI0034CF6F93